MSSDNSGLYLVSILAIVAIVSLLFISVSHDQNTSEKFDGVVVINEDGNLAGMGPGWKFGFYSAGTMIKEVINSIRSSPKPMGDPEILSQKDNENGETIDEGSNSSEEESDKDKGNTFTDEDCPPDHLC